MVVASKILLMMTIIKDGRFWYRHVVRCYLLLVYTRVYQQPENDIKFIKMFSALPLFTPCCFCEAAVLERISLSPFYLFE